MTKVSAIIPVYQDSDGVSRTVEALFACDTSAIELDIVVVDDGSTDGVAEHLKGKFGARLLVIRHPKNKGRSAARNSGMSEARGDFLLFLDSDCTPQSDGFILSHLATARRGACSVGILRSEQTGFWHLYQNQGAKRKEARTSNPSLTFTSANFMISAAPMRAVGGFDELYTGYGFEDRDLALRLVADGHAIIRSHEAVVRHDDPLTLEKVCQKMESAGELTSTRFAMLHPVAYKKIGYGRIDVRLNPRLHLLHALTEWARPGMIRNTSRALENSRLPFSLREAWARALIALSYLHGTFKAHRSELAKHGR